MDGERHVKLSLCLRLTAGLYCAAEMDKALRRERKKCIKFLGLMLDAVIVSVPVSVFLTTWSVRCQTRAKQSNTCVCKCSGVETASAMKVNTQICAHAADRDLERSKSVSVKTRMSANCA